MKYFFHVTDGEQYYSDTTDQASTNDADALDHAEQIAKVLASEVQYENFLIVIAGEEGLKVARVPVLSDAALTDSVGEGSY